MRRANFSALIAVASILCSGAGAVYASHAAALQTGGSASPGPAASQPTSSPADYLLGPNDRVTITVYGEDDLSREYLVGPAGKISIPLIGEVTAEGRTTEQLRTEIQSRLAAGFLKNPAVSVAISAFRNFYILGEVNKPGEFPYEAGLTITQAVAEAGGFTYRAKKNYVFLKHEGQSQEDRVKLTTGMLVQPGDTIRIGERYF